MMPRVNSVGNSPFGLQLEAKRGARLIFSELLLPTRTYWRELASSEITHRIQIYGPIDWAMRGWLGGAISCQGD